MKQDLSKQSSFFDEDRRDVLLSFIIIASMGLIVSMFIPNMWMRTLGVIMPFIQLAITKLFFAGPVKEIKGRSFVFVDIKSGKVLDGKTSYCIKFTTFMLFIIFFMISENLLLQYCFAFVPLLISRAILFIKKLPLSTLYLSSPYVQTSNKFKTTTCESSNSIEFDNTHTTNSILDSMLTHPRYSYMSDNIYHPDRHS